MGAILLDAGTPTVGTTTQRGNCYDQPQHHVVDSDVDPAADPGDFDGGPDAAYSLRLKDDTQVSISTCHGQTSFWTAVYVYSEDGNVALAGPGRRCWSTFDCKHTTPPYHARKLDAHLPAGSYRVVVDSAFDWNNGTFGVTVTTAEDEDKGDDMVLPELFVKNTDDDTDDIVTDGVEVVINKDEL